MVWRDERGSTHVVWWYFGEGLAKQASALFAVATKGGMPVWAIVSHSCGVNRRWWFTASWGRPEVESSSMGRRLWFNSRIAVGLQHARR